MTLIELGDVSSEPAGGREGVTEFRHGTVRRLVLAALVVLCVVTLGASARPPAPLIRELWSVPIAETDGLAVLDDLVLVQRVVEAQTEVSGYEAGTGRVRWARRLDAHTAGMETVARSGVLLITADVATPAGSTISAVDAATGATLWSRPGSYYLAAGPETIMLIEAGVPGGAEAPPVLSLVRTRDGGTVWQREVPDADQILVQEDRTGPARIVTASLSGEITVLDHADGTPLLTRHLPWTRRDNGTGSGTSITVTPGRLLVTRMAGAAHAVTVYRIDTLERIWSVDAPDYLWGDDCGPVICLTSGDNLIRAVDPDTGAERWTGTGHPRTGLLPGNERLLIQPDAEQPRPVLVEAATGQPVGTPGRGFLAFQDPTLRSVMLLDGLTGDPVRAVVNRLDLTTGGSTVLGTISVGGHGRCAGTDRFLACETSAGRLAVNRIG